MLKRFARSVGIGLALFLALSLPPLGLLLENLSFDLLAIVTPSKPALAAFIVELDEGSHRDLGQTYGRWDRRVHARLLNTLMQGPKATWPSVVFDVGFFDAGQQEENLEFANALKAHGRTFLMAAYESKQRSGGVSYEVEQPSEILRAAAAGVGVTGITLDADMVCRRHPAEASGLESLPWAVASSLSETIRTNPTHRLRSRWIRYYSKPTESFQRLSYRDALRQAPAFFSNKLVFVGGAPLTKFSGEAADIFKTPFSLWGAAPSSGVEIIATCTLNLVQGNWLERLSFGEELLLSALIAVIIALSSHGFSLPLRWMGWTAIAIALPMVGALFLLTLGLWFAWIPLMLQGLGHAGWLFFQRSRLISPRSPVAVPSVELLPTTLQASVAGYELVRRIGGGAYGEVWLGRNVLGEWHAVKIIERSRFTSPQPYEREFRGLKAFAPISNRSPYFLRILHVGREDERGRIYYVMDRADDVVSGTSMPTDFANYRPRTLESEMQKQGRLPIPDCFAIGICLARGLSALHAEKLVHRDIKPQNVVFVGGEPKLADIGLVTEAAQGSEGVSYLGTPGYIAPEGPGRPGADVYSLGRVLLAAFAGLPANQTLDLPTELFVGEPDPLVIQLNQILVKACEADPALRFQTADELAEALTTAWASRGS